MNEMKDDGQSLLLRKCSGEAFFARGLKVLCKKIIKSEGVWTCLWIFFVILRSYNSNMTERRNS